jgi:hypothetical protein
LHRRYQVTPPDRTRVDDAAPAGRPILAKTAERQSTEGHTRVVSREVVEFGFAVFGVAVMTETAIV